jgi:alkaline phosphatase D
MIRVLGLIGLIALSQPAQAQVAVRRPAAAKLPPASAVLTKIAFGSCMKETRPIPALRGVVASRPDLFLALGDNVYGDDPGTDPDLPILTKAYRDLAQNADFVALNASVPILATWDDHDFGANDAGAAYGGKRKAEALFDAFWGQGALGQAHAGVYGARVFGPKGKRVQIIMLDTRSFRSPLKDTDVRGAKGKERYLPDSSADKTLLGAAQWRWLGEQLQQPADLRLIVSSIQVLADGHGYEAWHTLPQEQARLYRTLKQSRAKGVIILSGDRHLSALYRQAAGPTDYALVELTASALNRSMRASNDEMSSNQIGPAYAPNNSGLLDIDWTNRSLRLSIRNEQGDEAQGLTLGFGQLGL